MRSSSQANRAGSHTISCRTAFPVASLNRASSQIRRNRSTFVSSSSPFKPSTASSSEVATPAHQRWTAQPKENSALSSQMQNVSSSTYNDSSAASAHTASVSPSTVAAQAPSAKSQPPSPIAAPRTEPPRPPTPHLEGSSSSGPTKFTSKPAAIKCSGVVTSTAVSSLSPDPSASACPGRRTTPSTSFGAYSTRSSSTSMT